MNSYEIARQALGHFEFVKNAFDNKLKINSELNNLLFNYVNDIDIENSIYYLRENLLKVARELLSHSQFLFILELIAELEELQEYNAIQYGNDELSELEITQKLDEWASNSSDYYNEYDYHFPNEQY